MSLDIARYETERRVTGSVVIAVGLALFAGMIIALAPDLLSTVDMNEYAQAFPPAVREAFGIDALGTLGGFLSTEIYQFGWVLLLGLYYAYAAGGLIAGDVERDRMDMLLSTPVTRSRVLVEKYLSLVPSILLINAVVALVVYVGAILVDEPLAALDVAMVHALSIPYLLACAGIGLLASVAFAHEGTAQRAGMGAVFALFMIETIVSGTDAELLANLSPTAYYDPTAILVHSTYDYVGAAILLVAAAALVLVSREYFRRVDVQ